MAPSTSREDKLILLTGYNTFIKNHGEARHICVSDFYSTHGSPESEQCLMALKEHPGLCCLSGYHDILQQYYNITLGNDRAGGNEVSQVHPERLKNRASER